MLSYVLHDAERVSEIYDLPDEDAESVRDAVESAGVRLFQDGSLQDEETGEILLDAVDDELIDQDGFESEAQEAGADLEIEDEEDGDTIIVTVDHVELRCVEALEPDEDDEGEGEGDEDALGVLIGDLALNCVLSE